MGFLGSIGNAIGGALGGIAGAVGNVVGGVLGNKSAEFQSTRPRGARRGIESRMTTSRRFQSTRPRGARPYTCYFQ